MNNASCSIPMVQMVSNSVDPTISTGPLAEYNQIASEVDGEELVLNVLDWNVGGPARENHCPPNSFRNLVSPPEPDVRIIFSPPDILHPRTARGLIELFRYYNIPDDFVTEGLRNVSFSFGNRVDKTKAEYTWFHFVSKDVDRNEMYRMVDHREDDASRRRTRAANFKWMRSGFVLKTSPSDPKKVTLLCFNASTSLLQKFSGLAEPDYLKAFEDPYSLLEVVMEELCWFVDGRAWMVADVFGEIEEKTIQNARNPGKAGNEVDFTGLHSIAKHIIYLQEGVGIALACVERLHTLHDEIIGITPSDSEKAVQRALGYRKSLVQSTQHRLASVDRRMTNILSLSFNLVTQTDSRTMQKESKSMKTVAVVSLVFLPLTTVATIFGSQLFTLESEKPYRLRMSYDFWLLWAVAVPLTLFVIIVWQMWYRRTKKKLLMHGGSGEVRV